MATGGSEETFEFTCTPCCKDGKQVDAFVYCDNCKECLCEVCFKYHQRSSASAAHKVLDKAAMQAGGATNMTSLPTDTCDTHAGKLIVLYCTDHGALCCVDCAASDHMSCYTVYIPDAAIGFRDRTRLKDQTDSTNDLAVELGSMEKEKENELQELQHDKNKVIIEVHTVTNDLIQRIKVLEGTSVDMVNQSYDPVEANLKKEIKYLQGVKSDTHSVLDGLCPSVTSEAQLYVNEIRARRHNLDLRVAVGENVSQTDDRSKFVFCLSLGINQIGDRVSGLESMVEKAKIYSAKLKDDYNVKMSDEKTVCSITGACRLPGGTVLITDNTNKRLKVLDGSYRVTDHCVLFGLPWGVTCTAPDEVAVTVTNLKKVQFVTVRGSMSLSRSFPTSDYCRGILYSGGQLYVACGSVSSDDTGHVTVFSLEGVQLNKIQTDPTGHNIFSCPYNITASCDGDKIYVAHVKRGIINGAVVVLDTDGTCVDSITDPSLNNAMGVCALDNGHILVSGANSNNVLQLDSNGMKVAELLNDTDGIKKPQSLCYDSRTSTLIVTMRITDSIKVFDLK